MRDFDLLDFLSHNYISLGTLVNQNMWRSYCYGDLNIWWWHLQEEANMPFGDTVYHFTENNRYRISLGLVEYEGSDYWNTYYLYIEDLKSSTVKVYVSTLKAYDTVTTTKFLSPNTKFQNLSIEILDNANNVLHAYSWNAGITILKGEQMFLGDICKSLLIFDKNEALLYLYDGKFASVNDVEIVIHFLAFSGQSTTISGIEYTTSEVTNMGEALNLYNGLNNTHTYINNWVDNISSIKITKDSVSKSFFAQCSDSHIVRPLNNDFPWFILFVFRPTPVSGNAPTNYNILLPVNQNYTGYHAPITRWKLNNGYSLSINCGGVNTDTFIQGTYILTYNQNYFCDSPTCSYPVELFVTPVIDLQHLNVLVTPEYSWKISVLNGNAIYRPPSSTTTYYSCNIPISSLFYYYGDNTENLIWLFHYDSDPNLRTAYVVYSQNMNQYAGIIGATYGITNIYLLGVYDKMYELMESKDTNLTINSYLTPDSYHAHLTKFFIYNTLTNTAPQIINGSLAYKHYLRFVLDDYTSSNLRIPIAIVNGDLKKNTIKYRDVSVDEMPTTPRYPIVQLDSLSRANMPDVILDGYIASLNVDAGKNKNENSTFGTLIPYYDLKEATVQEPHPEWYFRIHIHAGTWYYIFKDITSSNQMKTYRIQHNDGGLRIVLDVGLYFEIVRESNRGRNNKKYTIVYADIFPSVYWCSGNEAYEFLNVNVEWIQCRYSFPGKSMIRARPNNNAIIIGGEIAI